MDSQDKLTLGLFIVVACMFVLPIVAVAFMESC
jgi:hypothetical protein